MELAPSLALFLIGSGALVSLQRAYQSTLGRRQAWLSRWGDICALLSVRRGMAADLAADLPTHRAALLEALNRLPSLPPSGDGLPTAECLRAEQHLSGVILQIARDLENADAPTALLECEGQERHLALLRDDYNRHASAWNDLRLTFPVGLIARALVPDPLPLWEGA